MSEQAQLRVELLDNTSTIINNVFHIARIVPVKMRLTHDDCDIKCITIELLIHHLEGLIPVMKCLKHKNEITSDNVEAAPAVLQIINDSVVYRNQLAVMTVNQLTNDISMIMTCNQKCHGIESKKTVIRFSLFKEPYTLEDPNGQIPVTFDQEVHIHAAKNTMTSYLMKMGIGRNATHGINPVGVYLQFDSKTTAIEGIKSALRLNALKLKYAHEDKKDLCETVLESNKQEYNRVKRLKKEE